LLAFSAESLEPKIVPMFQRDHLNFSNSSLGCFTFHFKSLKDGNLVSEFQICQHPDFADQSNQLKSRFPQLLFTEFLGAISCINA